MRKPVDREADDDIAEDMLRNAYQSLLAGAGESGTTLTKGECRILLAELAKLPPLRSRSKQWWTLAVYSHMHEQKGPEDAVTKTGLAFGVSRSEVYGARKRMADYNEHFAAASKSPTFPTK